MKFTFNQPANGPQRLAKKSTSMYVAPDPNAQNHKRKLIFVGAIIFFGLLNVGLFFLTTQFPKPGGGGTTQPKPTISQGNTKGEALLVTVGDQRIYKSTVEITARESYARNAINKKALESTYAILVERAILDQDTKINNIIVTDAEIENRAKQIFPVKGSSIPLSIRNKAKYMLLKDKLIVKQIKSKDAFVISIWIPPYKASEKPEYAAQRSDSKKLLGEAERRMKTNEPPIEIAQSLYTKYPILQKILLLNTYRVTDISDLNKMLYENPYRFIFNKEILNNLNNQDFYTGLLEMKPKDIKRVNHLNNTGGSVIKVVSENTNGYDSYEDYLQQRKKELVKVYATL